MLVNRKVDGKEMHISLTEEGERVYDRFRASLKEMFASYSDVLGKDFSLDLSRMLHEASNKLEEEH